MSNKVFQEFKLMERWTELVETEMGAVDFLKTSGKTTQHSLQMWEQGQKKPWGHALSTAQSSDRESRTTYLRKKFISEAFLNYIEEEIIITGKI